MPNDVLVLGPFVFQDFAVPNVLPGGGKQNLKVHKMPGGDRIVDAMGPDDDDRQFTVVHVGSGAQDEVLTLDQMRIGGKPWPYSNGMEARTVVIASFAWQVERFPNVIHSTISLTPIDNPAPPQSGQSASDSTLNSDLDGASDTAADNTANSDPTNAGGSLPQTAPLPPSRPAGIGIDSNATPLTTPSGSGGIGSA